MLLMEAILSDVEHKPIRLHNLVFGDNCVSTSFTVKEITVWESHGAWW